MHGGVAGMMISTTNSHEDIAPIRSWWETKRLRYNIALVISLFLAYIALFVVVDTFEHIIANPIVIEETGKVFAYDIDFGGIAAFFMCGGACMGLLLANLCYCLGAAIEACLPSPWIKHYRIWAWRTGTAFSCLLPFGPALIHLFMCLVNPEWYETSPIYI